MILAFLYFLLAIAFLGLVFAVYSLLSLFRDKVPYVATPGWVITWLAQNLPAGAKTVVDIGCGDGRVLRALKKARPDITAIGYERNWWPYVLAQVRNRGTGVVVHRDSFYEADLHNADVVYCYLIQAIMERTEAMLRKKLYSGALVYSYGFRFPTWTPAQEIPNPGNPKRSKLRIYRQS